MKKTLAGINSYAGSGSSSTNYSNMAELDAEAKRQAKLEAARIKAEIEAKMNAHMRTITGKSNADPEEKAAQMRQKALDEATARAEEYAKKLKLSLGNSNSSSTSTTTTDPGSISSSSTFEPTLDAEAMIKAAETVVQRTQDNLNGGAQTYSFSSDSSVQPSNAALEAMQRETIRQAEALQQ